MYGAQDPGNWQSFKTRQDIQSLPLMEQKSKFIQEQVNFDNAMAAFSAQAHVGGIQYNPILSIAFDGSPLNAISGFTSGLEVTYTHDVTVTGIPSIVVPNGQQGGGSSSSGTLVCTILASDLTGDVLNLAGGDRYIALNGGSINSVGGRPARDVFAVSGINDTAVAS